MKKLFSLAVLGLFPVFLFAQVGHIMQGIGAHNMSMGGAATGQPLDINGALNWNPAGISPGVYQLLVSADLVSPSPKI
jgi:long-chain fatty acid transport protein